MASEKIQQALQRLSVLSGRAGTSPEIGKALQQAVDQLEAALAGQSGRARRTALKSAIATLWGCLTLIKQSGLPADQEQLGGASEALALLLPLELNNAPISSVANPSLVAPSAVVPASAPASAPVVATPSFSWPDPLAPFIAGPSPAPKPAQPAPPPLAAPPVVADAPAPIADFLWDVMEEHLEEAEFLLDQWFAAARSPRFTLALLQKTIEPRLVAHLDGLLVGGGPVADRAIWPAFSEGAVGPESLFAAAGMALLADPASPPPERLVAALAGAESAKARNGLRKAFQVTARADVTEAVRLALYATDSPTVQATLLAILAARRVDPGPIIASLLGSTAEGVLCAALNAVAATAAADRGRCRPLVEAHLSHALPAVRAAALRTGLIWNLAPAWQACGAQALAGVPDALLYTAQLGGPAAVPVLGAALASPETRRAALFALGFTGLADAVEACLPVLDDPDPIVARLAAEAIEAITALPLYEAPFAMPPAPDDQDHDPALPPLEVDLAKDLKPAPTDGLATPAAAHIRQWWEQRRASFVATRRYLRGEPFSLASLRVALAEGPLRRSGPISCEVAIRSAGETQLEALRLGYAAPTLPAALEGALHRPPRWH